MLYADKVEVRFGGLVAVNQVSLHIVPGTIHAVIGPNGAGKSTLFNAVSGLNAASAGSIKFLGEEIMGLQPHQIARKGIGRTFQNIKLFSSMSALENVLAGCHAITRSGVARQLLRTRSCLAEDRELREYSSALLERVGLADKMGFQARNLPYGEQRRLEIVRAMASKPRLLMLDEPAAGMNPAETEDLKAFIRSICEDGLTILLIEHDMKMVMSLADTITVLDHGSKIAEGDAERVQKDEAVIEAYLGKSYGRDR